MNQLRQRQHEQGREGNRAGCVIILVLLLVAAAAAPGCLVLMQQPTGEGSHAGVSAPPSDQRQDYPVPSPTVQPVKPPVPQPQKTIAPPPRVADALPILTPDPYPLPHHVLPNASQPALSPLVPEYTRKYTLRGNATGLTVNVTKGPLLITYDINPLSDCLDQPESCRGTLVKSVNRPYFTLTVRNLTSKEIVAEDGYAREFSSEKTSRTVKIFSEGEYHLTLTGNYLDVTIAITTGDSPRANGTRATVTGSPASPVPPQELIDAIRHARGDE